MAQLFIHLFTFLVLSFTVASASPSSKGEASSERYLVLQSNASSDGEKSVVAAVGDTIEMRCKFRVSGWSAIEWLKFQKDVADRKNPGRLPAVMISSNGTFSFATLRHVNRSDEGNYSCVSATLSSGVKSYSFQIQVKDELSCKRNSCSTHGDCFETNDGYTCLCRRGFIGTDCEFRDPCVNSPCQNGGACIAHGEEFTCNCVTGYGGDNCTSEVCLSNSCEYGTCSVKDQRRHCECPYNYAGSRCQRRCDMNIRRNRYNYNYRYCNRWTCKLSNSLYSSSSNENCVCDNSRNTGGNRCMMESDVRNECSDRNICNRHGTCVDHVLGYSCSCHTYYHGTHCEFYNECLRSDNLCNTYGGTCVDLTDGYKCRNCPAGQHGDKCQYKKNPCQVTCSATSMTAGCDTRFMNKKMKTIPIHLISNTASCLLPAPSGYYRRMTIAYSECGTKIDYKEDHVVYRNQLSVGDSEIIQKDSDLVITRAVGHFSFKMECTMPLVRNASALGLYDLSLMSNETMDLQDHKSIDVSGINIGFYKSNYGTDVSRYIVGDRLYAKVSINSNNNPTLRRGYILHLVSCFATAENGKDGERYELLRDGCILDETFRFEREPSQTAYFSFDSFSFKSNPGKLYLHCSTLACVAPECGVNCHKELPTTSPPVHPKIVVNDTITRAPGSVVEVFPTPTNPLPPDKKAKN